MVYLTLASNGHLINFPNRNSSSPPDGFHQKVTLENRHGVLKAPSRCSKSELYTEISPQITLVTEQRCLISEDSTSLFLKGKVKQSKIISTLSKYSCRYQIRAVLRIAFGIYHTASSVFPVPL